jgi:hypothetical protein
LGGVKNESAFPYIWGSKLSRRIQGDTRNEEDFVSHIKEVVESSSSTSRWHFVADNLDIHKSESLVRYVADISDLDIDLGIKGKSGVLQSIESRESFLIDPSHSIVFHYKPIHASWMNQVEIWFSILVRKLLRRASFASIAVQMDISGESTYCLKLGLFKPRCTSLTNEVYAPKQRTAFTAHIKQLNVLAIIYISFSSFLHEQCAHVGLT